jgi:hypothetical protein
VFANLDCSKTGIFATTGIGVMKPHWGTAYYVLWRSDGRVAIAPWEVVTCVPASSLAYDSSHVAWNIVIGKQGYHMAVCACAYATLR